jgi:hypothetical protein
MENTTVPVGGIHIQNGDQSIYFNPTDDITAKEVALIFQMFLNGIMRREAGLLDFGSYIVANNLQKHFAEVKDESEEG